MKQSARLANKFKKWRLKNNLTLREVSKITGLSNPFLSQFENKKSSISLDNAYIISKIIGVTL